MAWIIIKHKVKYEIINFFSLKLEIQCTKYLHQGLSSRSTQNYNKNKKDKDHCESG